MSGRSSSALLTIVLVSTTIGVSPQQRAAPPSTDATARAVAAAEAFLATLDPAQRARPTSTWTRRRERSGRTCRPAPRYKSARRNAMA